METPCALPCTIMHCTDTSSLYPSQFSTSEHYPLCIETLLNQLCNFFCMLAGSECGCLIGQGFSHATRIIAGWVHTNGKQPSARADSKQVLAKWGKMLISYDSSMVTLKVPKLVSWVVLIQVTGLNLRQETRYHVWRLSRFSWSMQMLE
jgi:hypothetical protein